MAKLIPLPAYEDRGYHTPCLIWQGRPSAQGYARITERGVTKPAHVVVWERVNGPVPDGHEIDHLCYVRMCVEVSHLECVTKAENRRRAGVRKMASMTPTDRHRLALRHWETRRTNGTTGIKLELRDRIRERLAQGEGYRQIRAEEHCSLNIISEVKHGGR